MIPRTVAQQAPLSLGFSRQEYWSGLPCPSPGDPPGLPQHWKPFKGPHNVPSLHFPLLLLLPYALVTALLFQQELHLLMPMLCPRPGASFLQAQLDPPDSRPSFKTHSFSLCEAQSNRITPRIKRVIWKVLPLQNHHSDL